MQKSRTATRRNDMLAPREALARHGERVALRAANDNQRLRLVSTNGALGLQTENGPFGNDSLTLAYDLNAPGERSWAGRVNSRTVSGTTAETFGFDTLGRMNSHVTQLGTFTYGYLGNSGQVSTRTTGAITTTWGYDTNANDRRLLTISTTGAVARNFTYASNAYQITGITDTPAATHPWLGQSWSFSYDGSDRLLTGNGTIAGSSSFQYDKLDNATSFAGAVASYNNLNQITAWNSSTHTYDNNGNLTGDGTRTYTYDAADRLKTVTQGGTTTTFAYDGLGRRLKQTVGTTETRYLWCGAAICQQRSNTDAVQKRFFAEGEYVLTGTKKYLTLTDHLGSVRDLIDITTTPTLVGSFDYTPYGATARSWGTVTPGYTYAGLFAHPQTGLLLSATRAYEPGKGRWLNKDPIRESGGINLYGYVGASPLMDFDPLGLSGGAAPVYQGSAAVERFMNEVGPMLGKNGYNTAQQISISVPGIDKVWKPDVGAFNPSTGNLMIIEGKDGEYSKFSPNQRACVREMFRTGNFTLFGDNAKSLGITKIVSAEIIVEPTGGSKARLPTGIPGVGRYLGVIGVIHDAFIWPILVIINGGTPNIGDMFGAPVPMGHKK